ncbi:MAG: KOW domain-containing RNA-binding protein [Oscillospiraceae bacterium]|nr:KOW domain-containing RNA-binding protein [Oscillospiraceae bacterium]
MKQATNQTEIVLSLAGHDKGQLYLVLRDEGDRALVADGKGRKLATPKRKSRKHLQSVGTSAHPAAERLHRGEAVSDKEVRAVLAAFRESEFPDGPEKGIQ